MELNIDFVTHVSREYAWLFDGQIMWRVRICQ